jgi:hypothetical protein
MNSQITQGEIDRLYEEAERLRVLGYDEQYRAARKRYLLAQAQWYQEQHGQTWEVQPALRG